MSLDSPPIGRTEFDVAIVGCGPTGALLANLLGAHGWQVAVFEREPGLLDLPRAVHFDGEVMRIFQSAGLADAILPSTRPSLGMQYIDVAGRLMLERKAATGLGAHGWANNYLFHQPDLEYTLRKGLSRFPGVRLFPRHEVAALQQDTGRATLTVRDLDTDAMRAFGARWVVGCDGARSMVRDAIGSEHADLGLHQSWLVVDVVLERDIALPLATVQFCDPARPVTFVNVTGRRRRWEIMLMPGDDPSTVTQPASIWRLLSRWIQPGDATLVRGAVYTFHALMAERWRDRRLLIAGDSAHQTPPFLGQGMCAGLRDAANLAWKIDRVLRGGSDTLLESYQSERAPHVHEFIATAVRLGNIIQTTDPVVAAQRDLQFAQQGKQEIVNLSPPLGPGVHVGPPPAGTLPGQPRLADGRLLDDAIGNHFAVLSADAALMAGLPPEVHNDFDAVGARCICDASLGEWLAGLGACMAVLRPDRYVFGVARHASDLAQLARQFSLVVGGCLPSAGSAMGNVAQHQQEQTT